MRPTSLVGNGARPMMHVGLAAGNAVLHRGMVQGQGQHLVCRVLHRTLDELVGAGAVGGESTAKDT
jgi:hypothetical protein